MNETATETEAEVTRNRLGGRLGSWGWWPLPITVALVLVGKVLTDRATPGDVGPQLHRIGYPLVVAAGLALLVPRALRGARGLAAIFGAIIGLVMVQVNVSRFDVPQNHTHFLYWDRYLFSEVFPMLVVIVALGATGILEWSRERWPDRATGRVAVPVLVVGALPLLLATATSLVTLDTVRAMNYQETFDNGYEFERDLVALMPDDDQPVLWTASAPTAPKDFPFPNTWYALGVPLQMSWGRDVVNVDPSKDVFAAERVIPARLIATTASCSGDGGTYVVEIETGGPALDRRVDGGDLTIYRLGRVAYELPTLTQPQGPGWKYVDVVANVYEVTTTATSETSCPAAS